MRTEEKINADLQIANLSYSYLCIREVNPKKAREVVFERYSEKYLVIIG